MHDIEYYVLEYRQPPYSADQDALLFAVVWRYLDRPATLRTHQHDEWRSAADSDDITLLDELLKDWNKAGHDAVAIFEQIDQMSVGMLRVRTHARVPEWEFSLQTGLNI